MIINSEFGKLIFYVSVDAVQFQARNKIGRELSQDELHGVGKGLESGLGHELCTVIDTAIDCVIDDQLEAWHREKERLNGGGL